MLKQDIQKKFGETLRQYRVLSGKSQEELAFDANMSTVYFGMLERGERCATIDKLLKISTALKIAPSKLVDYNEEAESAEAQAILVHCLKDIRAADRKKLALIFEQIVNVYNRKY
ncbi:MAG: helix-turn-helix domain-containing protein [Oscillospiraceae bacterium]|nr:helix-turn-helix domain-containing protein [Oscillospiraceae bacterium]